MVSGRQRMIGVWSVDIAKSTIPKAPFPGFEDKVQTVVESMRLRLRDDGTFLLSMGHVIEGKWIYRDRAIDFQPSPDSNMGLFENGIKAQATPEGDALTIVQDTPMGKMELHMRKSG